MKKLMIVAAVMGLAAASQASWTLIDNFDSYSTGTVDSVTSTWTGNNFGDGAIVTDAVSGNNLRAVKSTGWNGAETDLGSAGLADNSTATYFFQVMREGSNNDCMLGLAPTVGDIDATTSYKDFAVMPFVNGTSLKVRDGGSSKTDRVVTGMTAGEWYNVWLVVDNSANTFDMYYSTGTNDGAAAYTNLAFSDRFELEHGSASATAFAAFGVANNATAGVRVDNLYVDLSGANTTYAIPEPATLGLVGLFGAGTLFIRRRLMM